MKERLSNVLAWFVFGWISVIALTDLLRWALWNIAGIPLHLFMREDTLLRVFSWALKSLETTPSKNFFLDLLHMDYLLAINYVLVGSASFALEEI